jgi:uncharacterized RDD family membrane protein YckC
MEPPEQRPELPRMPSGVWEPPDEPAPRADYASWGARAGALILDNLLLAIPWIVGVVFFVAAGAAEDSGDGAGSLWFLGGLMILGAVVLPFLYFAILNGNERGQTLGKRVAGIRVRRSDGVSPLGIGRALGRYALTFLFGVLLGPLILLDYLWPLWDRQKQALHDKAVGSVVVEA